MEGLILCGNYFVTQKIYIALTYWVENNDTKFLLRKNILFAC